MSNDEVILYDKMAVDVTIEEKLTGGVRGGPSCRVELSMKFMADKRENAFNVLHAMLERAKKESSYNSLKLNYVGDGSEESVDTDTQYSIERKQR